jgi:hypothetical protein
MSMCLKPKLDVFYEIKMGDWYIFLPWINRIFSRYFGTNCLIGGGWAS